MNKQPLLTISIATLNSGKNLEKTLASVKNQTYKNMEVLIGDGGSKDNTLEIARKYKAIICFGKELGKARFEILKKAKGKYLMIIDSDQYIGKTLMERAVKKMEQGKYDALIFNEEAIIEKGTLIERLLAYDKWVVVTSHDGSSLFGAEFPRMFKTEEMRTFKWRKSLSILDDQIMVQENLSKLKNIGYLGGDGIKHKEVDSFKVFFKKFMRHGNLYTPTLKISWKTTIAHSLPRKNYFSLRVLKRPNIFLGLILLYFLKSAAVLTGIISYKLQGK